MMRSVPRTYHQQGGHVAASQVPQVHPRDVADLVAAGALLVDVRESHETSFGLAPGAVCIPLQAFTLDSVPTEASVVLICRSGVRSQMVAEALAQHGYATYNVAGGMLAWAAAGLPVVTADGSPGTVV
jgi:rhodanese-related sulfurtransferase